MSTPKDKRVYTFGNKTAEGNGSMKELLGGKGANLCEMSFIGLNVPPGFIITTETCNEYQQIGSDRIIEELRHDVETGLRHIEEIMCSNFGDTSNPLLVSVRSGARASMPGMMDTVLNVGLNDEVVEGLAKKTGKSRFAWDSYRRFIQMYGDVVMKVNTFHDGEQDVFDTILDEIKEKNHYENDRGFTLEDLKLVVALFKDVILKYTGKPFPISPSDQLWNAIIAVFESWFTPRAVFYRKLNGYPDTWGTAVNVQAMVYGNMGDHSASGVAFTRDAATGQNVFNGEYLVDAQGEDVVAGTRTPMQITKAGGQTWAHLVGISEDARARMYPSLEEYMPEVYNELNANQKILETHFKDMQDLEFTIQENRLWILQTRNGKRTGAAMVKIAMDMLDEGLIDTPTAILRIDPHKINELLHPIFDTKALKKIKPITIGLPASPGAASGAITFFSQRASELKALGKDVILVRTETSADDLEGMSAANGILTARGGMTSHAAVVARGMGKCCISGAGGISINYGTHNMLVNGKNYHEGDWLSLNGSTGEVFEGKIKTITPKIDGDFEKLLVVSDRYARMHVRANADTPEAARVARGFGAQGIGLCRTEHMFFYPDRIQAMREMILASDEKGRRIALAKLLPMQRSDFEEIFEAMDGLAVTIRLLDPPLHEFLPKEEKSQMALANAIGISLEEVKYKVEQLSETNPMLGHRGCRLGNTYPEITEMQTRAIIEAALNVKSRGINTLPEIMVPLTGTLNEMIFQEHLIRNEAKKVFDERKESIEFKIGTMIEVPRAALVADEIATHAEFFSFGTNDLTQMTFGYSRDDAGKFLSFYEEKGILKENPFSTLDQQGVGQLVKMGVERGRSVKPHLKIGICGEHGGDPKSIEFCHSVGMDYVSCSPFSVPIARVAAAQGAVKEHRA